MIAKLTGTVDSVGPDWAVIDVGGVGYLVSSSRRTLDKCPVGSAVAIQVETQVREDRIQLFGFSSEGERDWFRLLQTVQGVGGRVALAILSVLSSDQLLNAIASGDRTALSKADGVGPKLATRIASELKDKVGGIGLGIAVTAATNGAASGAKREAPSAAADAVSALVNLGYGRSEAFGAVARAATQIGEGATIDALIRGGLKELSA